MLLIIQPSSFIPRPIRPIHLSHSLPLINSLALLLALDVVSCVFLPVHHHFCSLPVVLVVLEFSDILTQICKYDLALSMHLSIVKIPIILGSRWEYILPLSMTLAC